MTEIAAKIMGVAARTDRWSIEELSPEQRQAFTRMLTVPIPS